MSNSGLNVDENADGIMNIDVHINVNLEEKGHQKYVAEVVEYRNIK